MSTQITHLPKPAGLTPPTPSLAFLPSNISCIIHHKPSNVLMLDFSTITLRTARTFLPRRSPSFFLSVLYKIIGHAARTQQEPPHLRFQLSGLLHVFFFPPSDDSPIPRFLFYDGSDSRMIEPFVALTCLVGCQSATANCSPKSDQVEHCVPHP